MMSYPGKFADDNWEKYYSLLRKHDPDLFRRTLEAGEGVSLKHGLGHKVAADVEVAIVFAVCDALDITP